MSTDGSQIRYTSAAAIQDQASSTQSTLGGGLVRYPDGSALQFTGGNVTSLRDRNGNEIRFDYLDPLFADRLTHIIDSIGREVTIDYAAPNAAFPRETKINYQGYSEVGPPEYPGGRTITIRHNLLSALQRGTNALRTVKELFPSSADPADPGVNNYILDLVSVSEIQLPNGKKYQFKYNEFAEITRMVLPTGGRVDYEHDGAGSSGNGWHGEDLILRRVKNRKTYTAAEMLEAETVYEEGSGATWVTDKDSSGSVLSRRVHSFFGALTNAANTPLLGYPVWNEGLEYKTQWMKADNTVLREESKTWKQKLTDGSIDVPPLNPPARSRDPRVTSIDSKWNDTNLVSRVETDHDIYLNPTAVREYAFGSGSAGALVRKTTTAYETGAEYTSRHILRLPLVEQVYEADGSTLSAKTEYNYDCYSNSSPVCSDTTAAEELLNRTGLLGYSTDFANTFRYRGNPTKVTRSVIDPAGSIVVRQQFDIAGNLIKRIDGRNLTTNVYYSNDGGKWAYVSSVKNPLEQSAHFQFHPNTGKVTSFTDYNSKQTTYKYRDPLDRPTLVTHPDGGSVQIVYDDTARKVTVTEGQTSSSDAVCSAGASKVSEIIYDGFARKTRSTELASAGQAIYVDTEFDALGRISKVSNPYLAGGTALWTKSTYDLLGRIIKIETPDGAITESGYIGNSTWSIDPAGKWKRTIVDSLGRMVRAIEDPKVPTGTQANPSPIDNKSNPAGSNLVTQYAYNALDALTLVRKAHTCTLNVDSSDCATATWQSRSFSYDGLGRLRTADNPETGAITHTYDGNGNLSTKLHGGITTNHTYDGANRITLRTYTGNTLGSTPKVEWAYDTGATNGIGRLTKVTATYELTSPVSTRTFSTAITSYDSMGRPLTLSQSINDPVQPYTSSYSYNLAGEVETETYPNGRVVGYCQDLAGRTIEVKGKPSASAPSWRKFADATWTPHDGIDTLKYWDAAAQEVAKQKTSYNSRLQPLSIEATRGTPAKQLLKLSLGYGVSAAENNGNIRSQRVEYESRTVQTPGGPVTIPAADRSTTYDYDSLNRLLGATEAGSGPFTEAYGYDVFGNRWLASRSGSLLAAPAYVPSTASAYFNGAVVPTNRINGVAHDVHGNMSALGDGTSLEYDAEGKLKKSVTTAGPRVGTTQYWYDGYGRRVLKEGPGGNESYVYSASGSVMTENTSETTGVEAGFRWMLGDHLGSTRLVLNEAGEIKQRYDYLPFGEEITSGINGRATQDFRADAAAVDRDRMKFTGKERDAETGLDYFGARYFSGPQGRFTSPDEVFADQDPEDPQSWNIYAYVRNNPLALVDLQGKAAFPAAAAQTLNIDGPSLVAERSATAAQRVKDVFSVDFVKGFLSGGTKEEDGSERHSFTSSERLGQELSDDVQAALDNPAVQIAIAFIPGPKGMRLATGTHGELTRGGFKESHHIIQGAAVEHLPGYNKVAAPAVQLPGPSTTRTTPHGATRPVQMQRGGGTYAAERRIGYKALRKAGLGKKQARQQIERADEYFEGIGVSPETPTRIPKDRK